MLLGLVLASAIASEKPPSYTEQAKEVSDRIELGFKLCAQHILRDGILAVQHQDELKQLGARIIDKVPEDVRENSLGLFQNNPIFARIGETGSNVYIVTAVDSIACRIVVSDSQAVLKARIDFVDRLRATSSWIYDKQRSGTANGLMKDELVIKSGYMITIVNGPQYIRDNGKGVQVFVTVALIPKAT